MLSCEAVYRTTRLWQTGHVETIKMDTVSIIHVQTVNAEIFMAESVVTSTKKGKQLLAIFI